MHRRHAGIEQSVNSPTACCCFATCAHSGIVLVYVAAHGLFSPRNRPGTSAQAPPGVGHHTSKTGYSRKFSPGSYHFGTRIWSLSLSPDSDQAHRRRGKSGDASAPRLPTQDLAAGPDGVRSSSAPILRALLWAPELRTQEQPNPLSHV